MSVQLRPARANDYDWIINVVDDWWGRPVVAALPRLFLDHFALTSLVAVLDGLPVGFLIGFPSPSIAGLAYVQFVGVDPEQRHHGVGRQLYAEFIVRCKALGCVSVRAATSSGNAPSIAFHRRLGFSVSDPIDGYDGPGTSMVKFELDVS